MATRFTEKFAQHIHYFIRALMVVAFALFLFSGNWVDAINTALIFLLMSMPTILKHKFGLYLPAELEVAIVSFVFLTLFLGSLRDFYERFPLWDGFLHFQSGLLLGIFGFVLVYMFSERKTKKLELSPGFISFFSVIFSMAVSVVWEIYEYAVDNIFGYNTQESGLPDTMGDLIVNASGALFVGIIAYVWMKRKQRLPFTPALLRGFRKALHKIKK